jgi:hypothetical protein
MLPWTFILEQKIAQKWKKKNVFQSAHFKLSILTFIPEH